MKSSCEEHNTKTSIRPKTLQLQLFIKCWFVGCSSSQGHSCQVHFFQEVPQILVLLRGKYEQKEKTAQNHMRSSSSLDLPSPAATYSIRTEKTGDDVDITAHRNSQVSLTRSYTFGFTGLLTKLFKHNILFFIIYEYLE